MRFVEDPMLSVYTEVKWLHKKTVRYCNVSVHTFFIHNTDALTIQLKHVRFLNILFFILISMIRWMGGQNGGRENVTGFTGNYTWTPGIKCTCYDLINMYIVNAHTVLTYFSNFHNK